MIRSVRYAIVFALLASGLALSSSGQVSVFPAQGGEPVFRVGGVPLSLPTPSGKLAEPGSDLRVLFEPMAPATNRLVAAFVRPDELKSVSAGETSTLSEYALIEVPRRAEFLSVDTDAFKQIADAVGKEFTGDMSGTAKEMQNDVDRQLKELGDAKSVSLGKPVPLGMLFSKPDAVGYGMVLPLSSAEKSAQIAMAVNVIRVRNRVLVAYFYTPYVDQDTVKTLKITDEEWADAILGANK